MNSFDFQRQDSLKRRWQGSNRHNNINMMGASSTPNPSPNLPFFVNPNTHTTSVTTASTANKMMGSNSSGKFQGFLGLEDDDLLSTLVPQVTVVLEGRSICQRISLHNHADYRSLAKALRQMFVDSSNDTLMETDDDLDLSNAVPGHLIAYEDVENDLLLAGDLKWKDFVRVAKRIRILPAKANSKKRTGTA